MRPASSSKGGALAEFVRSTSAKKFEGEYWTLVLAAPCILAFLPGYAPTVHHGFEALETAPLWFKEAIGASIAFAFGRQAIRGFRRPSNLPQAPQTKGAT